jgi:hypothetical protein
MSPIVLLREKDTNIAMLGTATLFPSGMGLNMDVKG